MVGLMADVLADSKASVKVVSKAVQWGSPLAVSMVARKVDQMAAMTAAGLVE